MLPLTPPTDPAALHSWLRAHLSLDFVRDPLLSSSTAPFDYLVHSFFEGKRFDDDSAPPLPADSVVWASRGGGKTFLGAVATLLDLLFKPDIQIRILAGSIEQGRRMHHHLHTLLSNPEIRRLLPSRITDRRVTAANGSIAEVLAASQTSVRGTRVQKIRCDEVDLFDPDVWAAAQLVTRSMPLAGPWGSHIRGSVDALSTMHRPMGLMWDVAGEAPARRALFRWGVLDVLEHCGAQHQCASCSLAPECAGAAKRREPGRAGHVTVADAVAMKSRASAPQWESEMLCLRPSRSDAVYPEFDDRLHVCDADPGPDAGPLVAGMDFGIRSPSVILLARVESNGLLRIVEEHVALGLTLEDQLAPFAASGRERPAWIGVDPAGHARNEQTGRSNIAVMRAKGLDARSRRLPLQHGIALVRARLAPASGPPRLLIHRRCASLIASMQRYHYPQDKPETLLPAKDGHDHPADALRYLVACLDRFHPGAAVNYLFRPPTTTPAASAAA